MVAARWRRIATRRMYIAVRVTRVMPTRMPVSATHVDSTGMPIEPACTPAPESKPAAKPYARRIRNGGISVVIAVVDIVGIVDRHVDVFRAHRRDCYVVSIRDLHVLVAPQVPELRCRMTQALDSRHHVVFLHDDRIAQLVCPATIIGHHRQHLRERDKRLHASIVRELRAFKRNRKVLAFQMLVFFSPEGIHSLLKNFPDFKQDKIAIACLGAKTIEEAEKYNLRVDMQPTAELRSVPAMIEDYINGDQPNFGTFCFVCVHEEPPSFP